VVKDVDDSEERVNQALEELRHAIRARVDAERLRDGLTDLGSDQALTAWLDDSIDEGNDFWIGFLEVDRFKSINDKFGYQDADEFLKALASVLKEVAADRPGQQCVAFRAHGDEFFLGGLVDPTEAFAGRSRVP